MPEFTAVRRPGRPLTPVLLEAKVNAACVAVVTLLGLGYLATLQPTLEAVAGALAVGVALAALRTGIILRERRSLRHTFHEPLSGDARESIGRIVLRQVTDRLPFLVLVILVANWDDGSPALTVATAGVLLSLLATAPLEARLVAREEAASTAELLYQRPGSWPDSWTFSELFGSADSTVYLVDEPDPSRWGPQDR